MGLKYEDGLNVRRYSRCVLKSDQNGIEIKPPQGQELD